MLMINFVIAPHPWMASGYGTGDAGENHSHSMPQFGIYGDSGCMPSRLSASPSFLEHEL
jgi:hypothetical protein